MERVCFFQRLIVKPLHCLPAYQVYDACMQGSGQRGSWEDTQLSWDLVQAWMMWKTRGKTTLGKTKNKKKQASRDQFTIRNVFLLHEIVLPPGPGGRPGILGFTSAAHL